MTISFIGANPNAADSTTSLSISVPGGVQAGDLLVAFIATQSTRPNAPAGWTDPRGDKYIFYRLATGSEAGSYAWTVGGAQGMAGGMCVYRGTAQRETVNWTLYQQSFGQGSVNSPGIWPWINNQRQGALQFLGLEIRATGVGSISTPAGLNLRVISVITNVAVVIYDKLNVDTGVQLPGDVTFTHGGTANWQNINSLWNRHPTTQAVI